LAAFKRRHDVTVIPISSLEGEGVDKLLRALWTKVRGRRTQVRPTATA
jgi:translation initiation factor IF-2